MKPEATFVFEGTVGRLNDSNVAAVQPDRLTAVVYVNRALRVPAALAHLAGREVTVALMRPIAVGATTVLSTVGWLYGENAAVIELEREPVAAVAGVTPEQQHEVAWVQTTTDRVTRSMQVVLGQVTGMRPHPRAKQRESEHDPDWWLADVAVDTTLKGPRLRSVPVTYANSLDVLWRFAPKLLPAQKSILVLHQDGEDLPDRRSRAVLHPQDVHSPDKLDTIAAML
jgi:hypothetical protein